MNLKRDFWALGGLIAFSGVFLICIPILVWKGSVSAESLVEIASVLLSWPVAVLVIALLFIGKFESAIRGYLEGMTSLKLPGGIQSERQPPTERDTEELPEGTTMLTPDHQAAIDEVFKLLAFKQQLTEAQKSAVEKLYQEESQQSLLWKFRYLSSLFVHNTKRVLKWLLTYPGQTRNTVDIYWTALIPDKAQRKIIINILCSNGMVEEVGGTIVVTSEGDTFLQWMEMSGETV